MSDSWNIRICVAKQCGGIESTRSFANTGLFGAVSRSYTKLFLFRCEVAISHCFQLWVWRNIQSSLLSQVSKKRLNGACRAAPNLNHPEVTPPYPHLQQTAEHTLHGHHQNREAPCLTYAKTVINLTMVPSWCIMQIVTQPLTLALSRYFLNQRKSDEDVDSSTNAQTSFESIFLLGKWNVMVNVPAYHCGVQPLLRDEQKDGWRLLQLSWWNASDFFEVAN